MSVPAARIRTLNDAPLADGRYVLYWMVMNRRSSWNFALDRAVEWCQELQRPLVILEALRADYPWASDRLHQFVIEGMAANSKALEKSGAFYYPYVEPSLGADKGLLAALAEQAAVVVTDDFPAFFLPRMLAAAARRLPVRTEAVDSNGLLPLTATEQVFTTAYSFRRYLQKNLRPYLSELPQADPFRRAKLPTAVKPDADVLKRWPPAKLDALLSKTPGLTALPIDHAVGPAAFAGGADAAETALKRFLKQAEPRYLEDRNEPELAGTSGLSPYLHFGHISAHEIFHRLMRQEKWSPENLGEKTIGKRTGWWGVGENAEAFLDQLITWRELGYNFCAHRDDYDRYESLPDWAQRTLKKHERDSRPSAYSLEEFEQAQTHDPLWNAAQMQLVRDGRLHNYLRMLWGKKILEWSPTPRDALAVMIELNNKYAVDGRNPNSYSGIFWVLGRYDRAWGPERPIFGTVRYMSSENTARKISVRKYVKQYAP